MVIWKEAVTQRSRLLVQAGGSGERAERWVPEAEKSRGWEAEIGAQWGEEEREWRLLGEMNERFRWASHDGFVGAELHWRREIFAGSMGRTMSACHRIKTENSALQLNPQIFSSHVLKSASKPFRNTPGCIRYGHYQYRG